MGKKYLYLIASSLVFVCYQNFSPLSEEEQNTLSRMNEMRSLDGTQSLPQLAIPQGGRDLESVSGDWLQRQGSIWLDGRDQRLVESLNHRLNSWLDTHKTAAGTDTSESASTSESHSEGRFRFTRINEMEYAWNDDSVLTCTVSGQGADLDYSHKLSANTHLGLDHSTGKSQTQLHLKYNW